MQPSCYPIYFLRPQQCSNKRQNPGNMLLHVAALCHACSCNILLLRQNNLYPLQMSEYDWKLVRCTCVFEERRQFIQQRAVFSLHTGKRLYSPTRSGFPRCPASGCAPTGRRFHGSICASPLLLHPARWLARRNV